MKNYSVQQTYIDLHLLTYVYENMKVEYEAVLEVSLGALYFL